MVSIQQPNSKLSIAPLDLILPRVGLINPNLSSLPSFNLILGHSINHPIRQGYQRRSLLDTSGHVSTTFIGIYDA